MRNWLFRDKEVTGLKDIPEKAIGFIYLIVNEATGEWYVGRKNLYSTTTRPPLKGQRRKRKIVKESDWIKYQSSSKIVKEWNSPYKEILEYCFTKKMLTFRELQAIICMNGLEDDKCLNDNVLGKFYKGDFEKEKLAQK